MPDKSRTPRRRRFPYVYQGEDHGWYVVNAHPAFTDGPFARWAEAHWHAYNVKSVPGLAAAAIRKLVES